MLYLNFNYITLNKNILYIFILKKKGLIGNVVVSYFSYAAPYGVAVVFFAISAYYIQMNWGENYGNTENKVKRKKE